MSGSLDDPDQASEVEGSDNENRSSASEAESLFSLGEDDASDDQSSQTDETDEKNLNTDAWGRKKSLYFNTDFVDEDRGRSYREEDRELAKAEEFDALEIQRKYLRNVHSSAFQTSLFFGKEASTTVKVAVPEWKSITKPEKLKALKKKWPHLTSLVRDFKAKTFSLKRYLLESSQKTTPNSLMNSWLSQSLLQLHFLYLVNLSFYMHLKKDEKVASDSAVLKRTATLKKLLTFCEELRRKVLLMASKTTRNVEVKQSSLKRVAEEHRTNKAEQTVFDGMKDEMKSSKRAVSYKIVKNKGLVPYRRKEYRNPRVRQRMKFKKAEIKRKGQIKNPRKEVSRYGGEFSGIHANVTRSIKLK